MLRCEIDFRIIANRLDMDTHTKNVYKKRTEIEQIQIWIIFFHSLSFLFTAMCVCVCWLLALRLIFIERNRTTSTAHIEIQVFLIGINGNRSLRAENFFGVFGILVLMHPTQIICYAFLLLVVVFVDFFVRFSFSNFFSISFVVFRAQFWHCLLFLLNKIKVKGERKNPFDARSCMIK